MPDGILKAGFKNPFAKQNLTLTHTTVLHNMEYISGKLTADSSPQEGREP
jgi:hypothetical protein